MFSREQRGFHCPARGAHDQFLGIFGGFVGDEEGSDFILTATLFVPYFGTISLQSGRDKSAARAATDHTGSIAYKDSNPSSQNEIQQRHAIHDSFSALDTISTSYHAIMPSIARRPNAQCGAVSPNQNTETYMPAKIHTHSSATTAASTTTTARVSSLNIHPLSLPSTSLPSLNHISSDKCLNYSTNAEKLGYDVHTDRQRMMVGAGCGRNGGVGSGGTAAHVFLHYSISAYGLMAEASGLCCISEPIC